MSAWNAAGVLIHFEYYYWYWIDLVTTTRLFSIHIDLGSQLGNRSRDTIRETEIRSIYYRRIISRLCSQRGMSTTWRSYSTILRHDYQGFNLKWTIGGYCGASFTGTQRRRIEYNITVRAEQRRMPVLALEIWRYKDSILWCSKPSWNITLYVRDHIIRRRRHLGR